MLSVGSEAVKAKVIALYAVVLSNANHRRQNVRRGEANRVCGLTAPLLNPISSPSPSPRPALSARPTASVRIRSTVAKFLHNFLLPFPISRSSARREIFQPTAHPPRSTLTNMVKNRSKTIYNPINHPAESRFRVVTAKMLTLASAQRVYVLENVRRARGWEKFLPTSPLSLSLCRAGARYGVVLRFERERGEEAVRQSRNARKRASDSIGRPIPSISPLPIQSGVIRCEDFRASAGQFP